MHSPIKTSEKWTDRTTGEEREAAQFNRVGIYVNLYHQIENEVDKAIWYYIEGRMKSQNN